MTNRRVARGTAMTANQCARCSRPTDATVCHADALSLAQTLREAAGHAEDAWTVIARQARYGGSGGARKAEPEPVVTTEVNRRNPMTTFGWQASVERPKAGALRPEPVPVDLSAAERLDEVTNTITTWARHVEEEGGAALPYGEPVAGPVCPIECGHVSCRAVRRAPARIGLPEITRWLAGQLGWLRFRPEAREAWDELDDACRMLRGLVDRPAERLLVGMCDCGVVLYAPGGRQVVQCPEKTCELRWDVDKSRAILRDALREKLFTAAEAAHLAAYWDERTSEQIRKLISMWVQRGRVVAHGWIAGYTGEDEARWPTYRFGDVIDRLATTERRQQREGAAA